MTMVRVIVPVVVKVLQVRQVVANNRHKSYIVVNYYINLLRICSGTGVNAFFHSQLLQGELLSTHGLFAVFGESGNV